MWDLTAGACSCELVPEVGTAVRSLSVALDGSMVRMGTEQSCLSVAYSMIWAFHAGVII